MFMGITAHHDAPPVHDYASAEAALERASKTPTGKRRKEKPYGFHLGLNRNHGVTWVRRDERDQSIIFRLYDTDVVAWYPDGSVEIENHGSVTTSKFARRFLPGGFHLHHPHRDSGHRGISYQAEPHNHAWSDKHICVGGVVRFLPLEGDAWQVDETTCDTMRFPLLDRAKAREVSKQYHLRDFEMWLSMAPRHMSPPIEHDSYQLDKCADALEARNFLRVAQHLPLVDNKASYGRMPVALPIQTRWGSVITMGSAARLRQALYEDEGCYADMTCKTLPVAEFDKRMKLVRELSRVAYLGRYGPQR